MATKMEAVIQHALRTFTNHIRRVPELSLTDIFELKSLTDGLASADIKTLGHILSNGGLSEFFKRKRDPLDYYSVYEDNCISVGVFLLNKGAKLPIHDHPEMYGIIKVLEGILKITSYTFVEFDKRIVNSDSNLFYKNPLRVTKHPEILLGSKDPSCVLTPTNRNIHEVESVEGPAAFLDILSPPYEDGDSNVPRVCHYFEEIPSENGDVRLIQVDRSI